jgi:transglutaminase/protease-like cytokinesis protein 3
MSVAESDEIIETENLMEDNDSNIIVFPNPSSDIVNLEMKLPDTYTLFLHNSDTGVLIYQSTFNGNATLLDLSKFTNKRIILKNLKWIFYSSSKLL